MTESNVPKMFGLTMKRCKELNKDANEVSKKTKSMNSLYSKLIKLGNNENEKLLLAYAFGRFVEKNEMIGESKEMMKDLGKFLKKRRK